MLEAMKAVLEKKITIRGAAKKFRVPYSTLKDRIHGRVQHGTKPGVKTALSPEEEEDLVRYVKVNAWITVVWVDILKVRKLREKKNQICQAPGTLT